MFHLPPGFEIQLAAAEPQIHRCIACYHRSLRIPPRRPAPRPPARPHLAHRLARGENGRAGPEGEFLLLPATDFNDLLNYLLATSKN